MIFVGRLREGCELSLLLSFHSEHSEVLSSKSPTFKCELLSVIAAAKFDKALM